MRDELSFRSGDWATLGETAAPLRKAVFVDEQSVPQALEWDGTDNDCLHIVAIMPDGCCIGTARLTTDMHIGRMAIHRDWRGRGLGREIVHRLLSLARERNADHVELAAQVQAIAFYEKLGFTAYGDIFDDAGIAHRMMTRSL